MPDCSTVFSFLPPRILNSLQNSRSIQKVVTLLIPGLTSSLLALPPLPTSATANPNVPLVIPLPDASSTNIPYIASTFSHACPTRAPGEPTRMHSVLSAFFHGPVSGEEKKKRTQQRLACELFRRRHATVIEFSFVQQNMRLRKTLLDIY